MYHVKVSPPVSAFWDSNVLIYEIKGRLQGWMGTEMPHNLAGNCSQERWHRGGHRFLVLMVRFPFKTQNKTWFLLLNTMLAKEKISEVRSNPQIRNLLIADKRHSKSSPWYWSLIGKGVGPGRQGEALPFICRWGECRRSRQEDNGEKPAFFTLQILSVTSMGIGKEEREEAKAWDVCAHVQYYGTLVRGRWLSPSLHGSQV